jgi:hypothetical protein
MGSFLVGDDNGTIAARPETITPPMEAPSFLCDVGVHELHELRELAGAGRR